MGYWSDLLDAIVDGTVKPPPYVRTLGTTRMKRWEPGGGSGARGRSTLPCSKT